MKIKMVMEIDGLQRTQNGYTCGVCYAPASHKKYYGAVTCTSCRMFFRRSLGRQYTCIKSTETCQMDAKMRKFCKQCRFKRCLEIGMNPAKVGVNNTKDEDSVKSVDQSSDTNVPQNVTKSPPKLQRNTKSNEAQTENDAFVQSAHTENTSVQMAQSIPNLMVQNSSAISNQHVSVIKFTSSNDVFDIEMEQADQADYQGLLNKRHPAMMVYDEDKKAVKRSHVPTHVPYLDRSQQYTQSHQQIHPQQHTQPHQQIHPQQHTQPQQQIPPQFQNVQVYTPGPGSLEPAIQAMSRAADGCLVTGHLSQVQNLPNTNYRSTIVRPQDQYYKTLSGSRYAMENAVVLSPQDSNAHMNANQQMMYTTAELQAVDITVDSPDSGSMQSLSPLDGLSGYSSSSLAVSPPVNYEGQSNGSPGCSSICLGGTMPDSCFGSSQSGSSSGSCEGLVSLIGDQDPASASSPGNGLPAVERNDFSLQSDTPEMKEIEPSITELIDVEEMKDVGSLIAPQTSQVAPNNDIVLKKKKKMRGRPVKTEILEMSMRGLSLEDEFVISQIVERRCRHADYYFKIAMENNVLEAVECYSSTGNINMGVFKDLQYKCLKDMDVALIPEQFGTFLKQFYYNLTEYTLDANNHFEGGIYFSNMNASNAVEQDLTTGCSVSQVTADEWIKFTKDVHGGAMTFEDHKFFQSPWCRRYEDELFYKNTVLELGQIAVQDCKIRFLINLIILFSQPEHSPFYKMRHVRKLHKTFTSLLFRYLVACTGTSGEANLLTERILELIHRLHRCTEIFNNERLQA